jgi:DNA-binding NarL/FixJ family response regulator
MPQLRLALLVPDGIIRNGIDSLIRQNGFSGYEVIAYDDFDALIQEISSIHILLLDISGRRISEIEQMLEHILGCCSSLKVIVISNRLTALHVGRVMQLGAKGFIYRDDLFDALVNSLDLVSRDVATMSAQVLDLLTKSQQLQLANELKPLEIKVLQLTARGYTVKEIASELDVSTRSVYRSRDKLREVLDASTNETLIDAAREHGLLDDSDNEDSKNA